jgi:hypothetical protein
MKKYTPRKAGKRWLAGAPDYILDCFDHPEYGDRYTIMFSGKLLIRSESDVYVPYLGVSDDPWNPQGVSMWGELKAHEAAAYRYRNARRRTRWLDLPERIRNHVQRRVEV